MARAVSPEVVMKKSGEYSIILRGLQADLNHSRYTGYVRKHKCGGSWLGYKKRRYLFCLVCGGRFNDRWFFQGRSNYQNRLEVREDSREAVTGG